MGRYVIYGLLVYGLYRLGGVGALLMVAAGWAILGWHRGEWRL